MSDAGTVRHAAAGVVGAMLWIAAGQPLLAQSIPADGEFIYHTHARDTLIGVCRVLLSQPQRWREVQRLNSIAEPRRMPTGTALRIPYSWLKLSPESAVVAQVSGSVSSAGAKVSPGQALAQGATIQTGSDGSVTLNLADGSVITLQKSSVLSLDEMQQVTGAAAAHDLRLKLHAGRAEMVVKPHRDVGRFEIETPVAISAVRGTVFRSGYNSDGDDATTETLDGTVGVSSGAARVSVSQGFGTRVDRGQPPALPVALLPAPGLTAVPARATDATLRVELTPVAGAKAYRVQLSTDADFHALTADEVSAAPVLSFTGLADGTYWLRARAIDPSDIEGVDATRMLVRHLLPAAPVAIAALGPMLSTGGQGDFAWRAVATAASYHLQVARDPGFSDLALERPQVQTTRLTEALPDGHYFWRVASVDLSGENGAWSDIQSLTIVPDPPRVEPPIVDSHLLAVRWEARAGAQYRVQIARNPEFTQILIDRSVNEALLSLKRPRPGNYYARVQIINGEGGPGRFGPTRRFEVPVPRWVKILLPILALSSLLW